MNPNLPDRRPQPSAPSTVNAARLARWQRKGEMSVARHAVEAWADSEKDRVDSRALGISVRTAIDEELYTLESGMHRANGSALGQRIVEAKTLLQSGIDSQRIAERFGS